MPNRAKLNDEMIERICEIVGRGNYATVAIRSVGIGEKTYYRWLQRGRDEPGTIFERFLQRVETAEAEREQALCETIASQSIEDWRAGAWLLERMHPKRYAQRTVVEATVTQQPNELRRLMEGMTDDELRQLRGIAERAAARIDRSDPGDAPPDRFRSDDQPALPPGVPPPSDS